VLVGCAFLGLAALLASPAARADELPRLWVQRTNETLDCPDAGALAVSVARLMGRPALDTSDLAVSPTGYDVRVVRGQGGYEAVIRTIGRAGRSRKIVDPGEDCAGLADALALSLAILLDEGAEPAPALLRLPPPPPRAPAPPPRRAPADRLGVAVGPAVAFGVLGPATAAAFADAEVRASSALALGLSVLWIPRRTEDFPPGEVDLSLVAGAARGCAVAVSSERAALSLCAEGAAGALRATGRGYPENGEVTRPWVALGAAAVASGRLGGPLGFTARADALVPLGRESFDVVGLEGLAYDTSPVGVMVGVGLRLALW
jgi:hypothetical protein